MHRYHLKVTRRLVCFLVFLLTFNIQAQLLPDEAKLFPAPKVGKEKSASTGIVRLVDIFLSKTDLDQALLNAGIRGSEQIQVNSFVTNSLKAFKGTNEVPSKRELGRILRSLPVSGSDARIRGRLQRLLAKKSDDLTKKDLVDAVNDLIYLANRHGVSDSTLLACSECVSDSLARNGFKFTMEILSNKQSKKVLKDILPKDPIALKKYLKNTLKTEGFGSFPKDPSLLPPEEEKALGLFLGLSRVGSKKQKELIDAIKEVSKSRNNKVLLFNPNNKHKLWKLFSEDITEAEMDGWTKMLKAVQADAKAQNEASKKAAFFRYLDKKLADNPNLKDRVDLIKRKKCFFQ